MENVAKSTIVYKRFYHLFKQGELQELFEQASQESGISIRIVEEFYEHQNWAVVVQKI